MPRNASDATPTKKRRDLTGLAPKSGRPDGTALDGSRPVRSRLDSWITRSWVIAMSSMRCQAARCVYIVVFERSTLEAIDLFAECPGT